jgi:hypothetical protein
MLVTPGPDQPEPARMKGRDKTHHDRHALSSAGRRRRQCIDDMVDDYVSWREACVAVAVSYQNWKCSTRSDQKLAFSVYIAALDREEQAATGYQRALARVAMA